MGKNLGRRITGLVLFSVCLVVAAVFLTYQSIKYHNEFDAIMADPWKNILFLVLAVLTILFVVKAFRKKTTGWIALALIAALCVGLWGLSLFEGVSLWLLGGVIVLVAVLVGLAYMTLAVDSKWLKNVRFARHVPWWFPRFGNRGQHAPQATQ